MKKILLTSLLLTLIGVNFSFAQANALIGTGYGGGTLSQGTIFQANLDGSNLHTVYSFPNAVGQAPWGKIAQAPNGKIYGVTYLGGCGDSCTLYEYDPVSGIGQDVFDFYCHAPSGEPSQGGLILLPDGYLYGMEQPGIIYKFHPNTHAYTLLNQTGVGYYGGLMQASDGKLYGMSYNGGISSAGTIFSYDLTTNVYTVLHSFNGVDGRNPYYVSLIQATDGKLYGTTYMGGANSLGVIFSYDITTNTYTKLYDFTGTTQTYCGVIQATNGKLYGMTYYGGSHNQGVIYSYDITGAQYTELYSFDGTNGGYPMSGLTQGSNGKLYGVTRSGGAGQGVAFSFDTETNTYTRLTNFYAASTGSYPQCDLIEATMPEVTAVSSQNALLSKVYINGAHQLVVQNIQPATVLTMFDGTGRNVLQTEISSDRSEFDLSAYPNGIYFVQLRNDETTLTRKVILSR